MNFRKEENEEQRRFFSKIVEMHSKEYSKYSIQNRLAYANSYMNGENVEAGGNPEDAEMLDEEANSKRMKRMFDKFTLEEWGKFGLEIGERDDPEQLASGNTAGQAGGS